MSNTYIKTPAEAKAFLRGKGTKVALQVACDSEYIFAEKSDFIEFYLTGPSFIDYDAMSCLSMSMCPSTATSCMSQLGPRWG